MRRILVVLGPVLALLWLAPDARAACDCATSTKAPFCDTANGAGSGVSGIRWTAPVAIGHPAAVLEVHFGSPDGVADDVYTCGRFTNGHYWVAAESDGAGGDVVNVTTTVPAPAGNFATQNSTGAGMNGYQYGVPADCDTNTIDTRLVGSGVGPLQPLGNIAVTSAPVVFYKAQGRPLGDTPDKNNKRCRNGSGASSTCTQYVTSFTIVSEASSGAPCTTCADSDGDSYTIDDFPPAYGDPTRRFVVDGTFHANMQSLDGLDLDAAAVPSRTSLTFQEAARNVAYPEPDHVQRYGRANRFVGIQNRPHIPAGLRGCCDGRHYGVAIANFHGAGMLRMFLDDWSWGWDGEVTESGDESAWFTDWESQLAVRHAYFSMVKISAHLPALPEEERLAFTRTTDPAVKTVSTGYPHSQRCDVKNCNIGGMLHGKKLNSLWGAWALSPATGCSAGDNSGSCALRRYVAGIDPDNAFPGTRDYAHYIEDHEIYNEGGVLYYGMDFKIAPCSTGLPTQAQHTSDTAACGNGMCKITATPGADSLCAGGSVYPWRSQIGNGRTIRLVATLLGAENIWNDDDYLDYAYTWWEGGRDTGHTGGQWCNPDRPSDPSNIWQGLGGSDSSDRNEAKNYTNDVLAEFFSAYRDNPGLAGGTGSPPVAADFTVDETINEDGGAQAYDSTPPGNVVTDADSDAVTCQPGTCTQGGSFTISCSGTAPQPASGTYTPATNFDGTDICSYQALDGQFSDTGQITFTVTGGANEAPVASDVGAPTWHDTDCSQRLRYVFASALGSNLVIPFKLTSSLITYSQTSATDMRVHRGDTGAVLPHDFLTSGFRDTGISTLFSRVPSGADAAEIYWKCPDTVAEDAASVWQDFVTALDLGDGTLPIDDLSGNNRTAQSLGGAFGSCTGTSCDPTILDTNRGTGRLWLPDVGGAGENLEIGLQVPSIPGNTTHSFLILSDIQGEGNTFSRFFNFGLSGGDPQSFLLASPDLDAEGSDFSFSYDWSGGRIQHWSSSEGPVNEVFVLAVSYDAGSVSNDPVMCWQDPAGNTACGTSETQTPSGTPNSIAGTAAIGNRNSLDRPFDGVILFVGYDDAVRTQAENQLIQDGFNGDLAPEAESAYVSRGADLSVVAPGVLSDCTDPDGNPVTASNPTNYQPVNFAANLTLNANGSMAVQREGLGNGNYSFDYTCSDGFLQDTATVSFVILESELGGEGGNDPPDGTMNGGTFSGGAFFTLPD